MSLSIAQFVDRLRKSEVLAAAEVDSIWADISENERQQPAETLISRLVAAQTLTAYQAAALLEGRGQTLVLGDYLVLRESGQNGQGQVFQARHRRLLREMTLKVLSAAAAAEHPEAFHLKGIHFLVQAPVFGVGGTVARPLPRRASDSDTWLTSDDAGPGLAVARPIARPASKPQEAKSPAPAAPTSREQLPASLEETPAQPLPRRAPWLVAGAALTLIAGCFLLCGGVLIGRISSGTPKTTADKKIVGAEPDEKQKQFDSGDQVVLPERIVAPEFEQEPPPLRLLPIDNQIVNEESELQVAVMAKGTLGPPAEWQYQLDDTAPTGAQIDRDTGRFSWTPSEEQGPGSYRISISVLRPAAPPLLVRFRVTVREVNRAPKFAPLSNQSAVVGVPFKLLAVATDPDLSANRLSFSLRDAPPGATIDTKSGELNWLPPASAAGQDYNVTVAADDDGSPPKRAEQSVRIQVKSAAAKSGDISDDSLKNRTAEPKPAEPKPAEPKPAGAEPSQGEVITNSLNMKLAFIPPGEFDMGSPVSEKDRKADEQLHLVRLTKGFYLGVYEVTQGEYEAVMGKNPSHFSAKGGGNEFVQKLVKTVQLPVENVSWEEATEFCRKLSAAEGRAYRLPTEAEWEYACRAKTKTAFRFGDKLNSSQANFDGRNPPQGIKGRVKNIERTTAVGSYPANAFGIRDMHGNVREWCADWHANYTGDADNPVGPATGNNRVVRGGSWTDGAPNCRSANRDADMHGRHYIGFRVARDR